MNTQTNIKKIPGEAWIFLTILGFTFIFNAMDRNSFSVILPSLLKVVHMTPTEAGTLATIYALGFALISLLAGWLSDRISRKTLVWLGTLIFSVFEILQAIPNLPTIFISRFLTGIGDGFQQVTLYAIAGAYFGRYNKRSTAMGILITMYGLGTVLGDSAAGLLIQETGTWYYPFILFGSIGLIITAIVFSRLIPKSFTECKEEAIDIIKTVEKKPLPFFNRYLIAGVIAGVIEALVVFSYISLFGVYAEHVHYFTPAQVGFALAFLGWGSVMGLLMGPLGDRINRAWLTIIAFVVLAISGLYAYTGQINVYIAGIVAFFVNVGASAMGYTYLSALIQSTQSTKNVGKAQAAFTFPFYIGATFGGTIMGYLEGALGWTFAAYLVFGLLPIIGIISMLVFVINPKQKSN